MKIAIVSARYMDQHALEDFFGQIFGDGQARVTVSSDVDRPQVSPLTIIQWARGHFQCYLPRALKPVRRYPENVLTWRRSTC
jgi:hypothetical protein